MIIDPVSTPLRRHVLAYDQNSPRSGDMRAILQSFTEQHPHDPTMDDFSQKESAIVRFRCSTMANDRSTRSTVEQKRSRRNDSQKASPDLDPVRSVLRKTTSRPNDTSQFHTRESQIRATLLLGVCLFMASRRLLAFWPSRVRCWGQPAVQTMTSRSNCGSPGHDNADDQTRPLAHVEYFLWPTPIIARPSSDSLRDGWISIATDGPICPTWINVDGPEPWPDFDAQPWARHDACPGTSDGVSSFGREWICSTYEWDGSGRRRSVGRWQFDAILEYFGRS